MSIKKNNTNGKANGTADYTVSIKDEKGIWKFIDMDKLPKTEADWKIFFEKKKAKIKESKEFLKCEFTHEEIHAKGQQLARINAELSAIESEAKADSIAKGIGAQQCTDRYSLCTPPFLIEMHGTGKARGIDGVMNTATAKGVKTGLVTNESWNHFISHVYGHGYVKEVHEPIGSVRTKQGHELISYEVPELEECHYRMLKPKEIKLAMAFEDSYKILGNGRDQVKQLGNAVTPPVMEWLVQQCVESLD